MLKKRGKIMTHARKVHRKSFNTCEHRGFGKTCHRCNPNPPVDRTAALKGEYGPKVQNKVALRAAAEATRSKKKGSNKKGGK